MPTPPRHRRVMRLWAAMAKEKTTHRGRETRERPERRGRQESSCNVVPGEHLSFIRARVSAIAGVTRRNLPPAFPGDAGGKAMLEKTRGTDNSLPTVMLEAVSGFMHSLYFPRGGFSLACIAGEVSPVIKRLKTRACCGFHRSG
jgi:hypothetical protein